MGFWTGLVQGTLMCGAALAALSLALPEAGRDRPDAPGESAGAGDRGPSAAPLAGPVRDEAAAPPGRASAATDARDSQPAPAAAPDARAQPVPAPPDDAIIPSADAARPAPASERLPEPVGSEFRRAADDEPRVPAPLGAPTVATLNVQAAAPAAPETHPARQSAPAVRPDPGATPVAPAALARGADSPELAAAPAAEAPIPVAPPGRVAVPALDRLPERGRDPVAAQAAGTGDISDRDAGLGASLPSDGSEAATQGGLSDSAAAVRGDGEDATRRVGAPPDGTPPVAARASRPALAARPAEPGPAAARPAPDLRLPAPLAGLAAPPAPGSAPPAAVPALPPPADDPTARPDLSDLRP
ncbi:hypothetical protein [Paracoccus luteus]|uniref:hypothetical protein n=1 Tax=Paracoccus luteus TaxID=2508543 RepID=UPI00106F7C53|nr:hypothetical protein [Paracoccus luteus]